MSGQDEIPAPTDTFYMVGNLYAPAAAGQRERITVNGGTVMPVFLTPEEAEQDAIKKLGIGGLGVTIFKAITTIKRAAPVIPPPTRIEHK